MTEALITDKEYGVVYTPTWVVDLILAQTIREYQPKLRVCDPSCGDGAFLVRLVEYICANLPAKHCRKALENITGFDIDKAALTACRQHLDETLSAKGKRIKIKWDLRCMDATDRTSLAPYAGHFDYVIGNPPYVRIQHLGKMRRERLQSDWRLAKQGSTDLYIAFFEIGMFLLKCGGQLGYITPNTYAKTAAGKLLRQFILQQHAIACLIDFGSHQIFKAATTYSLITVLTKNSKSDQFALYRYDGKSLVSKGMVSVSCLPMNAIWVLESATTLGEIERIRRRGQPLGAIADIHVGIQTLADGVFIMDKTDKMDKQKADTDTSPDTGSETIIVRDIHGIDMRIETAITRPILKASVMQDGQDIKERVIIFPYHSGKLMAEADLMQCFPLAYQHLNRHKTQLLARDKGEFDTVRWYAFGREFGLTTTFGDKLLTSGMNKKPNFQQCPAPEYTFYSGYCIKPKAGVNVAELLDTLNSSDMDFYIRHTSRDYQNGWKSYAKSFIQDYGVPADVAGHFQPESAQMSLC